MVAQPRLSFLTTAYRTEQYISRTIESVLNQNYADWEMIVVDNGNSDELARIVESHATRDPRVRLVRQENRGYRGGVMAAAAAARGNFYCVLDSDDQLMPEFGARVAAILDSDPGVDAVGVDAYRFGEPEELNLPIGYMRSIGVRTKANPTRPLSLAEVIDGHVPYYTAAIRSEAWDAVGGYEPGIDDVDESVIIWCRLTSAYDVRLLPDYLARYRLRPDSLSRDPAEIEGFERRLMRSFIEGASESTEPDIQKVLARTLTDLRYHQAIRRARDALRAGDMAAARQAAGFALDQKQTVRSATIVVAISLFPGLMRRAHPVKEWLTNHAERLVASLYQVGRRCSLPTS